MNHSHSSVLLLCGVLIAACASSPKRGHDGAGGDAQLESGSDVGSSPGASSGASAGTEPLCALHPGDLLINEIMVDPQGDDRGQEWLEITNPTSMDMILTRMVILVTDPSTNIVRFRHDVRTPRVLRAGGVLLIGGDKIIAPTESAFYSIPDLSFTNNGGIVQLVCRDTVIDQVAYGDGTGDNSMPVKTGVALQRDGNTWCVVDDQHLLNGTHAGTPGEINPSCVQKTCVPSTPPTSVPAASQTQVEDNNAHHDEQGGNVTKDQVLANASRAHALRAPAPGQIWINEVFADPTGADAHREWIEIGVLDSPDALPIDLNGVVVTQRHGDDVAHARRWKIESPTCVAAYPGQFVIIGFSGDASDTFSGDADASHDVHADFVLRGDGVYNDATVWTLQYGDIDVDEAHVPAAVSGKSVSLDPEMAHAPNHHSDPNHVQTPEQGNDVNSGTDKDQSDSASHVWCVAAIGTSTPGAANTPCGPVCYEGDWLRAMHTPTVPGSVQINEILVDPDKPAADGQRDWIELISYADTPLDLNGLQLINTTQRDKPSSRTLRIAPNNPNANTTTPSDTSTSSAADDGQTRCVQIPARGRVVLAGATAIAQGVSAIAALDAVSSTLFFNEASSVRLLFGDVSIDSMIYPQPLPGASYARRTESRADPSLSPPSSNTALSWYWCRTGTWWSGGYGTPGAANDACPASDVGTSSNAAGSGP